jgi:hypothetical protein
MASVSDYLNECELDDVIQELQKQSYDEEPSVQVNGGNKINAIDCVNEISGADAVDILESSCDDVQSSSSLTNNTTGIEEHEESRENVLTDWYLSEETYDVPSDEPLRAGDVIFYYHPAFRSGTALAERTATVFAVRPENDVILRLDNNECLDNDHQVKRMKEYINGKQIDIPNPRWRDINMFKLEEGSLPGPFKSLEARRLSNLMKRHQEQFEKVASEHGMPQDLLHSCSKKRSR